MAFIVALETIFALSKAHYGLSDGGTILRYVVSYGTTGVLTVTLAFWTRVEYSILRLAPWLKLKQTDSVEKALIVDYIDMWKLRVPYEAVKAHDYHVAAVTLPSLLLNITIVISTGLFILGNVEIPNYPEVLSLQTKFVDDASRLKNVSVTPYYLTSTLNPSLAEDVIGVADVGFGYPSGLTNRYAYQAFTTPAAGAREIQATVDGFSSGLYCQQAVIDNVTGLETLSPRSGMLSTQSSSTVTVNHEGCSTTLVLPTDIIDETITTLTIHSLLQEQVTGFTRGKCQSLDNDTRRLIITSMTINYTLSQVFPPNLRNDSRTRYIFNAAPLAGVALVCIPTYEIVQMNVFWTEEKSVVSRHPSAISRTLPHVEPWDIMDANLESYRLASKYPMGSIINDTWIAGDIFAGAILASECAEYCSAPSSLLDIKFLQEIATNYYRKYSAAVIYVNLMEQTKEQTVGISKRTRLRLSTQPISAQGMAAILVLCMTIALGMLVWPAGRLSPSHEPGSIVSVAALVGSNLGTTFPQHLGSAKTEEIEASVMEVKQHFCKHIFRDGPCLQHQHLHTSDLKYTPKGQTGSHNPTVLRPPWLVMLLLMLISLSVTLGLTLRTSITNEGLGPANRDSDYLHYAWTIFPAIVLALLSTWLSSVESQIRLWAPFVLLGHDKPHRSILTLDLLRDVIPVVLYREFRARHFGAFAITKSALFGSVFTMASAPLFHISYFPVSTSVQLRTSATFGKSVDHLKPSFPLASLILENNLSYQSTAFENLVFPVFVLEESPWPTAANISQPSNASSMRIQATIPALRPGLICRHSPSSQSKAKRCIHYNSAYYNKTYSNAWKDVIEYACDHMYPHDAQAQVDGASSVTYFGASKDIIGGYKPSKSDFAYAWGSGLSTLDYPTDLTGWTMECNTTLESLDVVVSYLGPDLVFDESSPPEPIESSVRRLPDTRNGSNRVLADMFSLWKGWSWDNLGSLPPPNKTLMDSFFQQLVTSRYAIPVDYLGDPAQVTAVENAIIFQHGIIAAQCISRSFPLDVGFDNRTGAPNVTLFPALSNQHDGSVDTGVYGATATDSHGTQRVVQDPVATRLLQVLLLATFALTLAGWVLGAWKPVLPRPPTSIASVLALLAGGDVLEHMYGGGKRDCLTLEEAMSRFDEDCSFRLGWGRGNDDGPDAPQRFGIWVVQNSVVDIDSDDTSLNDEII